MAGFTGKLLSKQGKYLKRITALDPAAPTIDNKHVSEDFRLSYKDADFVDVYHTDAGYFGFTKPIGHVDFYPNYGKDQPGCPLNTLDSRIFLFSVFHFIKILFFLRQNLLITYVL